MKNIYKLIYIFAAVFFIGCSDDDNTLIPQYNSDTLLVQLTASSITDNGFMANIAVSEEGAVFYDLRRKTDAQPSSNDIVSGGTRVNFSGAGNRDISFSDLESSTDYVVYAASLNSDNVRSQEVYLVEAQTPDTMDPLFIPADSTPAHQEAGVTPFLEQITLAFSETVGYQGFDIQLSGFFSGESTTITATGFDAGTDNSNMLTFNLPAGTVLPTNDFVIVTFAEGTFKDNSGKDVAELSGFNYFFQTRVFTQEEQIQENLSGAYNFAITVTNLMVGVPVVPNGTYDVVQNGTQITVLNGVETALGRSNDHTLQIVDDAADGAEDGIGFITLVDSPDISEFTFNGAQLYWSPSFFVDLSGAPGGAPVAGGPANTVGLYDFNTGEFFYHLDFADIFGLEDPANPGFFNPNYIGTYLYEFTPDTSASRASGSRLIDHPVAQEMIQAMNERQQSLNAANRSSSGSIEL